MLAILGSSKPGKIEGCRRALVTMSGDETVDVRGANTPSGVADVPVGDSECLRGAANRADACKTHAPNAQYWIGVESGLRRMPGSIYAMTTYAFILSNDGLIGFGSSSSHPVLRECDQALVRAGDAELLRRFPSGTQTIDALTRGAYRLEDKVFEAVICAFVALGLCTDPRSES